MGFIWYMFDVSFYVILHRMFNPYYVNNNVIAVKASLTFLTTNILKNDRIALFLCWTISFDFCHMKYRRETSYVHTSY